MSWKKSSIVGSEILTLFVNTLTTDDKYSRQSMVNFTQQLEAPLFQKQKTFSAFLLLHFSIFYCISKMCIKFRTFGKKKMSILEELFPKLLTPKEVVT